MRERQKKGEEGSLEHRGLKVRRERGEGEKEEVTEIDAEHENGLCHPFSSTAPEDKGSVSAICFFQHLLDDNRHLSPHQRKEGEESTEHTVLHVCSFSLASYLCPP